MDDTQGVTCQRDSGDSPGGAVAADDTPNGLIRKQLEDAGAGGADIDQGVVADGVAAFHLQRASLEVGHAGEIVIRAGKLEDPVAGLREGVRAADGGEHDERTGRRGDVRGKYQLGACARDEATSGQPRGPGSPAGRGGLQYPPGVKRENASVGEGDGGIRGRIKTQRTDAKILREDAGVTRSAVGDMIGEGPGGDIRLGRGGDEHDASGAVVGGEVGDPRGVGRGGPSAEDAIDVSRGRPDSVRGVLCSRGEIEADRAGGNRAGESAQSKQNFLSSSRREPDRTETTAGEGRGKDSLRGVRRGVAEQGEITSAVKRQGSRGVELGSIQRGVIQEKTAGREGGASGIGIGSREEQIAEAGLHRAEVAGGGNRRGHDEFRLIGAHDGTVADVESAVGVEGDAARAFGHDDGLTIAGRSARGVVSGVCRT